VLVRDTLFGGKDPGDGEVAGLPLAGGLLLLEPARIRALGEDHVDLLRRHPFSQPAYVRDRDPGSGVNP
jgi:hypothetical protein